MATRDWNKVVWKNDGSDNDLIREFLADPDNIRKCDVCPYKMEHPNLGVLDCGQEHCWVELSC